MEVKSTESQMDYREEGYEDDVFSIAISTDNHLGYKEEDPIAGQDSFLSFQEVLERAIEKESDFMILGGDLYHEKKPSRHSITRGSSILSQYVFGDQDTKFETSEYPNANYMNDHLSIRLPIFIIHGNHDDPCGLEHLSNIDAHHQSKQLNYFGKVKNSLDISVRPILFRKGVTKIALYGIGNIGDRLGNNAWRKGMIKFNRPLDETGKPDESYFNILVFHQNRYKGYALGVSRESSITDEMIDEFFDLVIWGHEHEGIPEIRRGDQTGVAILQPGSTIATSLLKAEAEPKHSFQLEVYKKSFKLNAEPLK